MSSGWRNEDLDFGCSRDERRKEPIGQFGTVPQSPDRHLDVSLVHGTLARIRLEDDLLRLTTKLRALPTVQA